MDKKELKKFSNSFGLIKDTTLLIVDIDGIPLSYLICLSNHLKCLNIN